MNNLFNKNPVMKELYDETYPLDYWEELTRDAVLDWVLMVNYDNDDCHFPKLDLRIEEELHGQRQKNRS
jgi:hypothetical protein